MIHQSDARLPLSKRWTAGGVVGMALLCNCGRSALLEDGEPAIVDLRDSPADDEDERTLRDPDQGPPLAVPEVRIDASLLDAATPETLSPSDGCSDETTLGYVITTSKNLYSFDPRTGAFLLVGPLACPTPTADWRPYSFAVGQRASAYILFVVGQGSGRLFRVDTTTANCSAADSPPPSSGFGAYGMGFIHGTDRPMDLLFAASNDPAGAPGVLARIAEPSLQIQVVAPFSGDSVQNAELTGAGDGLFAFYPVDGGASSAIAQIDVTSARVIARDEISNLPLAISRMGFSIGGWAFLAWDREFFLFTTDIDGSGTTSIVTRFDPADHTQVQVGSLPEVIVGAGVSPCGS